jgi:type IV fimbrial biogenesis protein FimT
MENSRGFTLLELLVTLAVVAVVTALAVPTMSASIRRSHIAAAHNEFLSSLYLLRSEAIKRNRVVKMCRSRDADPPRCDGSADGGWHTGWTMWVDVDGNDQIESGEVVITRQPSLRGEVRLTGNSNIAERVAFRSNGATLGAGNGTFTICMPGSPFRRELILSRTGRIRVREVAGDGSC